MRAALTGLHSPDINLDHWRPDEEHGFNFLLQAMIGPDDGDGADTFEIEVCSPRWLLVNLPPEGMTVGLHKLIVAEYDIG